VVSLNLAHPVCSCRCDRCSLLTLGLDTRLFRIQAEPSKPQVAYQNYSLAVCKPGTLNVLKVK